jgi:hypothetical protein
MAKPKDEDVLVPLHTDVKRSVRRFVKVETARLGFATMGDYLTDLVSKHGYSVPSRKEAAK